MAKRTRFIEGLAIAFFAILLLHSPAAEAKSHHKTKHASHHKHSAVVSGTPEYASVIMDAQSGDILEEHNANVALPPASLTKMMTLFLTFEALENGRLHMNKYLTVSANATRQAPSRLGLKVDERITVKQAILAVVTRSANDVAYALGETIGGDQEHFTRMMTERAKTLGMKHSYFANPTGLPNPLQKSSAYDMAVLGRATMQYFPQYYHFFSTKFFVYNGQVVQTHNNLMNRYEGMDGFKTGYTAASGFNLVASAVRDNRRVIVAMFGGHSALARDNHVADLMNRGFDMMARGQAPVQVAAAETSEDNQPVATKTVQTTSTRQVVATIPGATPPTQKTVQQTSTQTIQKTADATKVTTTQTTVSTTTPTPTPPAAGAASFAYPAGAQVAATTPAAPGTTGALQPVAYLPTTMNASKGQTWGIQIGAYTSPALGQQALQVVQTRLKDLMATAQPVVVPSVTTQGTVYRARMVGLTADAAAKACQQLSQCMAFVVR